MKNIKKCLIIGAFLGVLIIPNISSAATVADLQAQIQSLLAQLQQLQAQLAQMQGQPATWCHDFSANLRVGDMGGNVAALNIALEKEGFGPFKDPSDFTEETASAVSGFQQKYKNEILTPWGLQYGTGFVGKTTRAKLNQLYGCGVIPTPTPTPTPSPVPANQPPVISGVSGPTTLKINETGKWEIKASDPEQGVLTYQVLWGDEATGVSAQLSQPLTYYSQTVTFTHSYSKAGIYNPTFTVTDNQGLSAKTSISVNVGAVTAPYYTVEPTGTLTRGQTYTFSAKITNGLPNSKILFYLQRPDGTMKFSGATGCESELLGRCPFYTDTNGNFSLTTQQLIPIAVQTGTWISWITVGGIVSNRQYHSVVRAAQPSITVLSPNGGETVNWSSPSNIKLQYTSAIYKVSIALYKNDTFFNWIATDISLVTGGTHEHTWLPSNIISSANLGNNIFKIYILGYKTGGGTVEDKSDAPFSIAAAGTASLTVSLDPSTPASKNILVGSTDVEISKFKFVGNVNNDVMVTWLAIGRKDIGGCYFQNLKLYDGLTQIGATVVALNTECRANFEFDNLIIPKASSKVITLKIDVPALPTLSNDVFALGINGISCGAYPLSCVSGVSGLPVYSNTMTVISSTTPTITVLSPNGGEALTQDITYNIKWSNSYPITSISTATLSVYGADGIYKGGIGNVWNTGSFSWTVGKVTTAYKEWLTLPLGQYRIRVTDSTSGTATDGVYDESDAPFSIAAAGVGQSSQLNQMANSLESAKAILNQLLESLKNL